jgi:hypothetical protein
VAKRITGLKVIVFIVTRYKQSVVRLSVENVAEQEIGITQIVTDIIKSPPFAKNNDAVNVELPLCGRIQLVEKNMRFTVEMVNLNV